jgi:hypothetical protein
MRQLSRLVKDLCFGFAMWPGLWWVLIGVGMWIAIFGVTVVILKLL